MKDWDYNKATRDIVVMPYPDFDITLEGGRRDWHFGLSCPLAEQEKEMIRVLCKRAATSEYSFQFLENHQSFTLRVLTSIHPAHPAVSLTTMRLIAIFGVCISSIVMLEEMRMDDWKKNNLSRFHSDCFRNIEEALQNFAPLTSNWELAQQSQR